MTVSTPCRRLVDIIKFWSAEAPKHLFHKNKFHGQSRKKIFSIPQSWDCILPLPPQRHFCRGFLFSISGLRLRFFHYFESLSLIQARRCRYTAAFCTSKWFYFISRHAEKHLLPRPHMPWSCHVALSLHHIACECHQSVSIPLQFLVFSELPDIPP